MLKLKVTILLLVIPLMIFSQLKTPFVMYDHQSDSQYKKELKLLKKDPDHESLTIIKSIAELSYDFMDWDTAIDYYERLIVDSPQAENYFKLSVAAARKSLEVPRLFSVSYVVKARKYAFEAHQLRPKQPNFLSLLIQLYAEIPPLLGGDIAYAEKKANELRDIDPVAGGMMQAYIFDIKNNLKAAKSKIIEVFRYLKEEFSDPNQWDKELGRNLIFELGRAAAEYQIEPDLGMLLLEHYQRDFGLKDNYPLEWAYFYQSKIYLYLRKTKEAEVSLIKSLEINPDFNEGLGFLNTIELE